MKTSKIYAYLAENKYNEGFICEAYNKAQMKRAKINMKLNWRRFDSFEKAKIELLESNIELKHASNVTNFSY